MEKVLNLYQKINVIMREVKYVQKTDKKVNGNYTFVTHDAVSEALHEPMAMQGIVMIPSVDELVREGNLTIAKMRISFVNADAPEEKIELFQYGYGIDTQDKGVGKAVSYAVKYALLKLFCLETGDDPERDSIERKDEVNVSMDLVENKKKFLYGQAPAEDKEHLDAYIKRAAAMSKCTENEVILKVNDYALFFDLFGKWKAKNVQPEAKAA